MKPDENNSIFELATGFINETSEHVFLTGKAGTGKTTFLRHIRNNTHKRTVVAAPTGVAAINAGGITLHSLFQLPFEPYIPGFSPNSSQKNRFRFSKAKLDLLRQLELLIIDEVSMLRADTLDAIDDTLRGIRRNPKPFGGIQILYIGDMFQLPPVAKNDEWNLLKDYYASTFFFHSKAFEKTKPVYLELKKVYRQSDQRFIDLLNNVRNNCLTASDLDVLNSRFYPNFSPPKEENYITLTTHNYKADQINNKELANLPGKEHVYQGEVTGEFPDYALPTDMQLRLKENAQIMFIKNDPAGNYYNGRIATISRILNDLIYVYLPEKNTEILVPQETWKNIKYTLDKETGKVLEEELGAFVQYPLTLAWAVTIHKSQGLTFEKAIVDIGSSFAAGQAYVALSRCTSLEGIVLQSKIHSNCILTDEFALGFSKTEKDETELQHLFTDGKQKFWAERLLMYFDWKEMYQILREFERLLDDKTSDEFYAAQTILNNAKRKVRELENTSLKFQQQLSRLIEQEHQTHDIALLKERSQKAIIYFHENIVEHILKPLQHYIQHFPNPRKAKTFYKNIISIEEDIRLFMENMKRIRYNNIPLADELNLLIPERKDVFSAATSTDSSPKEPIQNEKKLPKEKTARLEKGATQQMTLMLFKEGKSIEEIAAMRTLAVSTIEGHLASFIGMELSIEQFLKQEDLDAIMPVIQPFLEEKNPPFRLIFDRLGGKYSFGQLRMAFNYFMTLK